MANGDKFKAQKSTFLSTYSLITTDLIYQMTLPIFFLTKSKKKNMRLIEKCQEQVVFIDDFTLYGFKYRILRIILYTFAWLSCENYNSIPFFPSS